MLAIKANGPYTVSISDTDQNLQVAVSDAHSKSHKSPLSSGVLVTIIQNILSSTNCEFTVETNQIWPYHNTTTCLKPDLIEVDGTSIILTTSDEQDTNNMLELEIEQGNVEDMYKLFNLI